MTTKQKTKLRNAFENNMSANIKLSKTRMSKKNSIWWFSLSNKIAGPLMKVAVLLAENILPPLGITAAASTINAGI